MKQLEEQMKQQELDSDPYRIVRNILKNKNVNYYTY